MCEHGVTKLVRVCMPAHLSHTGRARWTTKPIDACIAPLVFKLNALELLTANSCCGHGKGPGGIVFHDGTELSVEEAQALIED